jgi:hypothetical protein
VRKKEMSTILAMCILLALLIPAVSADTCSFCEFINISNITRGVTDHWFLTNRSAEDAHPQYILTAGTRAFTGKQSLGGFNLTDLLDPVAPQDAATKNYVDTHSSSSTNLSAIYPVGFVVITSDNVSPGTSLGFGNWSSLGTGYVLVGV